MDSGRALEQLPVWLSDSVAEALGQERRVDPVAAGSGGPAGNARLTAWTGLVLLALCLAELLTLLDVRGLISWHVAIGALLGPPALLKTASTGWRMVGYYRGAPAYRQAGPPPLLLRLLGPLVVISTLGLIGSGVLLVLLGQASSRTALLTVLGFRVDWITLHQGAFVVWGAATGLHVLGRILPAVEIAAGRAAQQVPGRFARTSVLVLVLAAAIVSAVVLVGVTGTWSREHDLRHGFGQVRSDD